MAKEGITARATDYAQWYLDIVDRAGLSEWSPVRGCMVIKPHGYAIWELIQQAMDRRIKETGHENAYFPLFIPQSFLTREAEHVEGFAPELAIVTHAGGEELAEPLVVRPTSETIIGVTFSKWVQSWRDLPLLINQWANVVRWEKRTRPFLRSVEFLWQEGHTVHTDEAGAEQETLLILNDVYADFVEKVMAVPVYRGRKSEREKFPGALRTYSIEAMMQDGKALQAGTSHNLGQNFARSFNIMYTTPDNEQVYAWTTSWGASTRLIGALIMAHSDDDGLVLPPLLAPIQVVVVPIYKNDTERSAVLTAVERLTAQWRGRFRFRVDDRPNLSPGFRFSEWEVKGVPVRVEVGPKDLEKGTVALARRDQPGKQGKQFIAQEGLDDAIGTLLDQIQHALYDRALRFREEHTFTPTSYAEFQSQVDQGFVRCFWDGTEDDEARVKEETKATIRVILLDHDDVEGTCILTGRATKQQVIFARSY
ncbi:MAG: proline--tRNA ligase [Herpetosiphon sp.]